MNVELSNLLFLLEERLVQHDNNRREVQTRLEIICAKILKETDLLEEKINEEIRDSFSKTEERIFRLTEKVNSMKEGDDNYDELIEQAHRELASEQKYNVIHIKKAENFIGSYKLSTTLVKVEGETSFNCVGNATDQVRLIVSQLQEHLDKAYDSVIAAQVKVAKICTRRRNMAERLKKGINNKLEPLFRREDARIQNVVKIVKENTCNSDYEIAALISKAKMTLLISQEYSLGNPSKWAKRNQCDNYILIATKKPSLEHVSFGDRKPLNVSVSFTERNEVSISFTFFDNVEIDTLKPFCFPINFVLSVWEKEYGECSSKTYIIKSAIGNNESILISDTFRASTTNCLKVKIECNNLSSKWSDDVVFTTPEFKECCAWKNFLNAPGETTCFFNKDDARVVTKIGNDSFCAVTGDLAFPLNRVTSWNIKILRTKNDDGRCICVGIAPPDMCMSEIFFIYNTYGWHFNCYESSLISGPPHNYKDKPYGPRKKDGQYIRTGDSVGIVMDMTKGELSFVLNGVNLGVAFEGIPLDKPLVPCVILKCDSDSVELDTSEVKETLVDRSVPAPSNIEIKKGITWDSAIITWDEVSGASFYQVEVDGTNSWDALTTNAFTKRGFLGGTEHSFRVRTVRGSSVSEWSGVVKGKTLEESFETGGWKECPETVNWSRKYIVDENNPRVVATNGSYFHYFTIIGNTPVPANSVTLWNIKVLNSEKSNGCGIYVGVAPYDINQDVSHNHDKCGWYFHCYDSKLRSGPPHNYRGKQYGSVEKNIGKRIRTRYFVGVMMDTTKGDLSFVINGVNLGVAFEEIPLDKPLIPCVLHLGLNDGGFIELVI